MAEEVTYAEIAQPDVLQLLIEFGGVHPGDELYIDSQGISGFVREPGWYVFHHHDGHPRCGWWVNYPGSNTPYCIADHWIKGWRRKL